VKFRNFIKKIGGRLEKFRKNSNINNFFNVYTIIVGKMANRIPHRGTNLKVKKTLEVLN
jgi:nucleoside permease NupC